MIKWWQKSIIYLAIISLMTPSLTGLTDFSRIKKAQAEEIGNELLTEKDKLALEGKINEPGDRGISSMNVKAGDDLVKLQSVLAQTALSGKINFSATWASLFNGTQFSEVTNEFFMSYWNFVNDKQRLVLKQSDIDAIKQNRVDRRIKKFLLYLVTPKYLNGAGHELINVSRIVAAGNDVDKQVEPSILTHSFPDDNFSQAADIAQVDYLRCTLIIKKKNWVGSTSTEKKVQSPRAINLAWQGGQFGNAQDTLGLSLNQMALGLGSTSFMDVLDQLGLGDNEYSQDEFKDNINIGDVARYIGKGIFEQVILSPNHSWNGSNFDEITENLGRAIIADQLGLPRESIQGQTLDEIEISVGRYMTEKNLNLPFGSLTGNTSLDILKNTGARKLEKEMGLPAQTIDYQTIKNKNDLRKIIGQRYVEAGMYIAKGTLVSDNYDDFIKALGKERSNWVTNNPTLTDERLQLPPNTTKNLIASRNFASYKTIVGETLINKSIGVYQNYLWDVTKPTATTADQATATDGAGNPVGNKRDEAFDTPEGTVDQFLNGDFSSLEKIGAYEIAKTMSTSDEQREIVYHWVMQYKTTAMQDFVMLSQIDTDAARKLYQNDNFHVPSLSIETNPDFNLNETFQNYQVNENELLTKFETLQSGDLDAIFLFGQATNTFKHEGQTYLFEGLKNGKIGEKVKEVSQPYLNKYNEIVNDFSFYKDRVDDIKARSEKVQAAFNSVTGNTVLKDNIQVVRNEFNFLSNHLAINSVKTSASNVSKSWQLINAELEKPENKDLKAQTIDNINAIRKDIYELQTGKPSDIDYSSAQSGSNNTSNNNGQENPNQLITKKDLVFLVTHPKEISSFAKNIACKKIELQLDIPTYSMRYFLEAKTKSADILKSSIGQASAEERLELPNHSFQGSESRGEYILGLWNSLYTQFTSQDTSLTDQKFQEKISNAFNIPYEWKDSGYSLLWDLIISNDPDLWKPYESNLKEIDNKLSIQEGTTLNLLNNKITVKQYNELIGSYQLGFKLTDSLYNSGISFMGERLTSEDFYNILIGHTLDPFAKIGGKKIDAMLNVPEGYGYKLVTAQNNNQRMDVLAEIGGYRLANMLGIDQNINLIGVKSAKDLLTNIGNATIESKIGLASKSFSDNLDETINTNGYVFTLAFGLPNILEGKIDINWEALRDDIVNGNTQSDTYKEFAQKVTNNPELKDLIKQSAATNINVGGIILPNPIYISPTDLITAGASENEITKARTFQYRAREIDNELSIPAGTTIKLIRGDIAPKDYRELATENFFINLAALKLDDLLGLEEKYHFSLSGNNGLVQIYQDLKSDDENIQRNGQAKLYDTFSAVFSIDLDQKAGFTPGTIKSIILNPSEARNILINQGLIKIEDMLHLGPSCMDNGSCSDLSKYGFEGFLEKMFNAYQVQYDKTCTVTNGNPIDPKSCEKSGRTAIGRTAVGLVENAGATYLSEKIFQETNIQIPQADSLRIVHGDFKIFGYVKIAQFAAQQLQKVKEGKVVPSDYMITYEDVRNSFEGNPVAEEEIRQRAQSKAADEFDELYPADFLMPSTYTDPFRAPSLYNPNPPLKVNSIFGYNQTLDSNPDSGKYFPPPQELEVNETISQDVPDNQYNGSISYFQTLPPTTLTLNNSNFSFLTSPPKVAAEPSVFDKIVQRNQDKANYIKESGNAEVAKQRKFWRTEPMYKLLDSQLYLKNSHIPRGFSRAMIEGNTTDRVYALSGIIELSIKDRADEHSILSYLPENTLPTLINYFSKKPSERDFGIIQNSTICGGIDNYLKQEVFGGKDFPPAGFSLSLFAASQNHWKLSTKEINGKKIDQSFNQIMVDFAWTKLTSWADEKFGWAPGTGYQIYKTYQGFETARKAYIAAKAAKDIAKTKEASQSYNAARAALYTFVVTTVFSKQLSSLDEQLGLVPGSMAQVAGIGIQILMHMNPWISIGILVVTNLFAMRVVSVEYMCTPCGYYPGYSTQSNLNQYGFFAFNLKQPNLPIPNNVDSSCSVNQFDAYKNEQYQEGLKQSAIYKSGSIMQDALNISEVTGEENLRPTQVIMYDFDSIKENAYKITELYGAIDQRENMGVWSNESVVDHIHIGY